MASHAINLDEQKRRFAQLLPASYGRRYAMYRIYSRRDLPSFTAPLALAETLWRRNDPIIIRHINAQSCSVRQNVLWAESTGHVKTMT